MLAITTIAKGYEDLEEDVVWRDFIGFDNKEDEDND